ncbi:hypothetical protein [Desertihabitans aurantiacus]|uniref:hypothetical protein n=1 Tax=Desertihabitans aurantiacus TaxID=2282477 RepID=UPI0018E4E463|nr:hypothetical protein [Desertihabitans aurantiacus]
MSAMTVVNEHSRLLAAPIERCGHLLEDLAGEQDRLWPSRSWPAMRLSPGMAVGAVGGHGPVRYTVAEMAPGRHVRFRFTGPTGFDGGHEFLLEACGPGRTRIRHVLTLRPRGRARLTWPLVYRPLHDALLEDAFDQAEAVVSGTEPERHVWSGYVRFLRWVMALTLAPRTARPR